MASPEPRTQARSGPQPGDPFDWFVRVPNRLEAVKSLRALLASTCEQHGVDEEATQELLLTVSEIVNNSIEHVAGRGPGGYHEVDVRFGIAGGRAVGVILDEGEGGVGQSDFDGAAVPGIDDGRGRGLFLIRVYVDDIRVARIPGVGTEVRFEKRLGGAGGGGGGGER
jgi:anti-sigma regulatory factor (Ser/Thr protein kinase)